MLLGTILILLLEFNHFFKGKEWHEAFIYAFFQSSTTRNGGLATMDVSQFYEPTLLVISFLMFIGASPSSVGGGVRTTTFALNVLHIYHFAKGKKTIKIFKREIHEEDVNKSVIVTMMAVGLCFMAVILLSISEKFTLMQIIFEVCSAFGTTGLSMGITPDLSTFGKYVIIALMFIGRIGILSFLFIINIHEQYDDNYHYPKERIIVG